MHHRDTMYSTATKITPAEPSFVTKIHNMETLTLTSSAFKQGGMIPSRFTCDGENINPPLEIGPIPDGTMSLAITVVDPDIPREVQDKMGISVFDHWLAFNIPPSTKHVPEDTPAGTQGANSGGKAGYTGPCPPADFEPVEHRYNFTVYALDMTIELPEGVAMSEFQNFINGHILASAVLTGRYRMQNTV